MAYVQKLFNDNFLEYASYVIKERAIPHLDDGLKPVQRRIIHSLFEMDDGKFHKVANVVGHCMKYHPHGDASIYEALVNIAQKDLFIDKQGNFGNILTGDMASAARYIECRLLPLTKDLLYNPQITEYTDSYDGRNREPVVFPAKIPVVLIHGAEGIAVGMSTKILPHNFQEVLEALKLALDGKSFQLFPDFPSAGLMDASQYNDGNGSVLVRAKLDTSDEKRIVIREIPFGTTTESLIESIENAAKKGKIKIAGLSDFTTEKVEIEIRLPRGVYTSELVDALYAFTDCQVSHSCNLLVIKDHRPEVMTVTQIINYHAGQLVKILKKELELEQGQLQDKLHLRTLERIFIEERIYKQIEEMKTHEAVYQAVHQGFIPFKKEIKREITDENVKHLLEIPIRRISLFDINKAKKEIEEIQARLKQIAYHLKNLTEYAKDFLDKILEKTKNQFPRLTQVGSFKKIDIRDVALRDKKLRYDKTTGYLGWGISTGEVQLEVSHLDKILLMKKDGNYLVIKVPEKQFIGKGLLYIGQADKDELAKTVFSVIYKESDTGFLFLKRFQVDGFILEKEYNLLPENTSLVKFTTRQEGIIKLEYKPKPLLRVLEESLPLKDFLVKGAKAQGVRLTTKEVASVRFLKGNGMDSEPEEDSGG